MIHKLEVFKCKMQRFNSFLEKEYPYPIVVSFWSFIFDSMSPERMISKVYSYFKLTHYASQMLFSNVINVKTVQLS